MSRDRDMGRTPRWKRWLWLYAPHRLARRLVMTDSDGERWRLMP